MPLLLRPSTTVSIIRTPLTFTSGFGVVSVSGYILLPKPAAIMMARFTI